MKKFGGDTSLMTYHLLLSWGTNSEASYAFKLNAKG